MPQPPHDDAFPTTSLSVEVVGLGRRSQRLLEGGQGLRERAGVVQSHRVAPGLDGVDDLRRRPVHGVERRVERVLLGDLRAFL